VEVHPTRKEPPPLIKEATREEVEAMDIQIGEPITTKIGEINNSTEMITRLKRSSK
jgi:hypothetical protein